MTCAACATRIARALNKIDGVDDAEVNLASSKATVRFDPSATDPAIFTARIEKLGYHVPEVIDFEGEERSLRMRALTGLAFALPAMTIHMAMTGHSSSTRWLLAVLAAPVVWWIGWPYHRKAVAGARNGTLGMDALVSLGSGTAWISSFVVLVQGLHEDIHFGTAAMIVALITVGNGWKHERRAGLEAPSRRWPIWRADRRTRRWYDDPECRPRRRAAVRRSHRRSDRNRWHRGRW